jgi:hypothetical protein
VNVYVGAKTACERKVRHSTEAKALIAAARCAGRRSAKGLRVYRCPDCKGWHITHKPLATRAR